jgi:hypothetical protein
VQFCWQLPTVKTINGCEGVSGMSHVGSTCFLEESILSVREFVNQIVTENTLFRHCFNCPATHGLKKEIKRRGFINAPGDVKREMSF